jgi:glycosyltransferase involved in cell wall biosynthesis
MVPHTAREGDTRRRHSRPFLLAAGRLAHPQGFDLLLRAFGAASARPQELRLVIGGDGPEGRHLRDLAAGGLVCATYRI